jgi:hypothetical protein
MCEGTASAPRRASRVDMSDLASLTYFSTLQHFTVLYTVKEDPFRERPNQDKKDLAMFLPSQAKWRGQTPCSIVLAAGLPSHPLAFLRDNGSDCCSHSPAFVPQILDHHKNYFAICRVR